MKILFTYNARIECDEFGNLYGNEINNDMISRYKSLGDDITFLVRKRPIKHSQSTNFTRLDHEMFKVVFVPEFNSIGKYLLNLNSIHRIIKEEVRKADVIISRVPSTLSRIAVKYSTREGKPYLLEVVGCPWDALWNYSLMGKLLAPYAFFSMKRLVRNAPFVVYVTNMFLQKRYPNTNQNIGISDVILSRAGNEILQAKICRLRQSFNSKSLVLGTAAGIDIPYKGHMLVLRAISYLKRHGYEVRYHVAGKGTGAEIRKQASKLNISDCVVFAGQISFDEMADFYDKLDLYIQPSLQEGLPRALIEAMNRACPCIGSNAGGIPELLDEKFVLKSRNPAELADLIIQTKTVEWEDQARINHEKAAIYYPEYLQQRRNEFFLRFKQFYSLS